jgi:hypothetical protein
VGVVERHPPLGRPAEAMGCAHHESAVVAGESGDEDTLPTSLRELHNGAPTRAVISALSGSCGQVGITVVPPVRCPLARELPWVAADLLDGC